MRWPIESAHTWPVRSTCSAELIATTFGFSRITAVSLVRSHGWNSTSGLSSTKSNSRREPVTNDVTIRPSLTCLKRFVTTPASTRSTRRSENISVCTPRSRLPKSRRQHRVGNAADAHLQRGAVLHQGRDLLADAPLDLRLGDERVLVQRPVGVR